MEIPKNPEYCCDPDEKKLDVIAIYRPGYATEYTDNFIWGSHLKHQQIKHQISCGASCSSYPKLSALYEGKTSVDKNRCEQCFQNYCSDDNDDSERTCDNNNNTITTESIGQNLEFISDNYDSLLRNSRLKRDENGNYIDPFKDLITTSSGRRLMYDPTHPDMIFPSQHSSELADTPNVYSFKSPIQHIPEIPWKKDLQWQAESVVGRWPTKMWKTWENVASCPVYDGHDDQCRYSKFKLLNWGLPKREGVLQGVSTPSKKLFLNFFMYLSKVSRVGRDLFGTKSGHCL
ncbi:hypothetical protein HELRODRAFT_194884 [Helobdella robusta]|uniref:Uncharacterized protein n=1 Tax=Helobdella robusta TaxID=6412 RepID=T1FWJ1_HELRO|nr:hypothetical protein HELRODRAFT_194884 [Helobdella robusta]ESO11147.1 hypothetical protein HELRODRAFT_194884 [Helobdella robusta]